MYKLSVVVPIYNVEKHLVKCIESIRNQTLYEIEIILINDGSTDSSGEICDYYAKLDNRIKVIHKLNGGLSSARNVGIEVSNCEYIGFVDGDDYIDEDMYEILYKLIKVNNAQISEVGVRDIYRNKVVESNTNEELCCDKFKALYLHLKGSKFFGSSVCHKLFSRDIIGGLRFEEGKIHEDMYFTYNAIYRCEKLVSKDIAKYNYITNRENSITNTNLYGEKYIDKLEALKVRTEFIFTKDLKELIKISKSKYYDNLVVGLIMTDNDKCKDYINKEIENIINSKNEKYKLNLKQILTLLLWKLSPKLLIKVGRIYYKV